MAAPGEQSETAVVSPPAGGRTGKNRLGKKHISERKTGVWDIFRELPAGNRQQNPQHSRDQQAEIVRPPGNFRTRLEKFSADRLPNSWEPLYSSFYADSERIRGSSDLPAVMIYFLPKDESLTMARHSLRHLFAGLFTPTTPNRKARRANRWQAIEQLEDRTTPAIGIALNTPFDNQFLAPEGQDLYRFRHPVRQHNPRANPADLQLAPFTAANGHDCPRT